MKTKDAPLDVSSYSRILYFSQHNYNVIGKIAVLIEIHGETFDITDTLYPLMTEKEDGEVDTVDMEEVLVIPVSGGRSLMLTHVSVKEFLDENGNPFDRDEKENPFGYNGKYWFSGYLCW